MPRQGGAEGGVALPRGELQEYGPDVAVISARLEDGPLTGFKILQQLRASESKISTVMLLDSPERDLVVDAFRGGARGVFCRGYAFNTLPKCIRMVHEGQISRFPRGIINWPVRVSV